MTSTNKAFTATISAVLFRGFIACKVGYTLLVALLLHFSVPAFAQTLDWANHPLIQPPFYGGVDEGKSIATDASGNVYMTGYYGNTADFDPGPGAANLTSTGASDIYIAKYDAAGNYLWAKSVGGASSDVGYGIALDAAGNVYITGFFEGTADFDPGAGTANRTSTGTQDIFIAKYDGSGNYLWAKSVGGTESDTGYGLAVDAGGNVCVTGYFINSVDFDPGPGTANLTGLGLYETFIAKYDASGNYLWAKSLGGPGFEVGQGIALDAGGNLHITGYFTNTVDFNPGPGTDNLTSTGNYDIFIAKYDASGNYIWAKGMGDTEYDEGRSLAVDAAGNVYVTGYFQNVVDFDPGAGTASLFSSGSGDIFITKYDASGNYLWAKSIGDSESDYGYGIALDPAGNVHVTGLFQGIVDFDAGAGVANVFSSGGGDIFITKYDASGNYLWAKNVGSTGNDIGYGIALGSGGNVYVTGEFTGTADFDPGAGTANLNPGKNTTDAFALSLSPAGNYNWAINWGQYDTRPSGMTCLGIARDASGNVYATGYFDGENVDFDPGPGIAGLTSSASTSSLFIVKYDASGNYIWAKAIVGTNAVRGEGIAVDAGGNVYVAGGFYGTADFDPGPGTANLNSGFGGVDAFIAKYDASGNYLWAGNIGGESVDIAYGIALDAGGNVCVTGFFNDMADFDPGAGLAILASQQGDVDIFIAKYDPSGNYLWAKNVGGTSDDYGLGIAVDASDNIHITGYYYLTSDFDPDAGTANLTSTGLSDIFIAKYNASGNYVWAKSMGGDNFDQGHDLVIDGSGNAYLTGSFRETADFDPGAGTANRISAGGDDIFIAKYSASGNYIWAKGIGGGDTDNGTGLALDGEGNLYLTGTFLSTLVDFDPGAGIANLANGGLYDCFIAQYDASGNYQSAMRAGGTGSDAGFCIAAGSAGTINVGGYFEETADFDPGAGTTNHTAIASVGDIFIAQYNFGAVGFTDCPAIPIQADTDPGQCSALVSYTVTANGMPALTYSFSGATVTNGNGTGSGSTFNTGLTTVTVTAAAATCVFTVTVSDNEAPVATCPAPVNVPCAGNLPAPNPVLVSGTDNCGIVGKVHLVTSAPYDVSCVNGFRVMRFYRVFDAAGNSASCSQIITVDDKTLPIFTFVPVNVTVQCNSVPAVGSPTATDNCGGAVPVTYNGQTTVAGACPDAYIITRQWTATDACGNTRTATQRINVIDTQKPNFTSTPANITVQCNAIPAVATPTATDNCDVTVAVTYNGQTQTNGACPNAYTLTRTWTAADNCGNTKTVTQRIVNTTVQLDASGNASLAASAINNGSADACGIASLSLSKTSFDCSNLGVNSVTLSVTDNSGKTATCSATVTVQDNVAPTAICQNTTVQLDAGGTATLAASAINNGSADACGIASLALSKTSFDCSNLGVNSVTLSVTDNNGKTATCSATVTVQDNIAPTAVCQNTTLQLDAGGTATLAATAINNGSADACGIASLSLSKTAFDCSNLGANSVTLSVTDNNGKIATCSATVTVQDNILPTFTCPPSTTVTCLANVPSVNMAAVTANDNCGTPTKTHAGDVVSNEVCANRKTVTRTYRATDASGNSSTCTQVITVFDYMKPNFTSVPANVTVQCNGIPAVGVVTATDGCGGAVTVVYDGQTTSNILCADKYTLTRKWTATDACGNTQTATKRIVVTDTQAPNFMNTPIHITVQCDAIPNPATPTATDNCDAAVAVTYNGQTTTAGTCPNASTIMRTWTAADNCGNTKTVTQRIVVVDNGKPVFTDFPANASIACGETLPAVGSPTASDGCGSATVSYLGQTTTSGNCPGSYQIKRTWKATDACGNSTAATQTIQVSDTGVPVFTSTPGPITIECGDPLPPLVNPTASDACGGYAAITFLGNVPSGSGCAADYTVTRTWRAEDLCGNSATTSQVITVQGKSYGEEGAENRKEDVTGLITHRSSLIVTPNPTTDRIWLDLTDFAGESVTVSIHSDLGQLIWERRISAVEELKLPISLREAGAAAGMYTVSVWSASGVVSKRVVLVE
ncbi:MAG: hypothetical protein JNJ90_17695 [Saprospiraceae bacterium]|jgi:hypothetical protein|nr:hypothetical protein [Saprospiraceae bacterium]